MDPAPHSAQFATTRWSMVLSAARSGAPEAPRALGELCHAYWFPLYVFIRRQGWSAQDAEDLTQDFFARILEKEILADVGPEKGRFRTFLLVCVRRFLINERERRGAAKRGGGRQAVSFDRDDAERQYGLALSSSATPDQAFERRWAIATLENALQKLAEEFATRGKEKLFNHIKVYLAADQAAPPYAQMARQMGVTEAAVKVAVHRLRGRFRILLEQEIASTLASDEELADEIDYLMRVLSE
jgi:RNA polymerase sigma factor (sigma-70 family)